MKPLAALAFAALLLAGCKKDDLDPDGLVPATQEGKNTGDFLLNGQPWGPKASVTSTGRAVGAIWYKIRGGRQITVILGRRYKNDDTGVNIVLPRIVGPAVFTITDGVSPAITLPH